MSRRLIALFLVVSLLFTSAAACTFLPIGKKTVTKRTVTFQALWAGGEGDDAVGGYSTFKVTAEVSKAKKVQVLFGEEEVGGAGSSAKAAGWVGVTMASFLLGHNVSDYRFTFEFPGRSDGPSAGGITTAAVMAALLGDELKKDVIMTGTINPDGTIGPVGGIPQKLDGAKKAGKKTVLIPVGQRYDIDLKTGDPIDVVGLGEEKGLKVKEVSSIYEAYKELTGKELPKLAEASDAKVELPTDTYDKVKARTKKWYSRYLDERTKYDTVPTRDVDAYSATWVDEADFMAGYADKFLGQGMVASAYGQAVQATAKVITANHFKALIEVVNASGAEAADAYLLNIAPSDIKVDAMWDDLKARKPTTLADSMVLAKAYSYLAAVPVMTDQGNSWLDFMQDAETADEFFFRLMYGVEYFTQAAIYLDAAEDTINIGMGSGTAKPANKANVKLVADALRKAADANMDYFNNVVLKETDESTAADIEYDPDYILAASAAERASLIKEQLGATEWADVAIMGNALESFVQSSSLIARYYSLGVYYDEDYNLVVSNEKCLIEMLSLSEEEAKQTINAATKIKAPPVIAMLDYEAAKVQREGELGLKLTALKSYWGAAMSARLITLLGSSKMTRADAGGETGAVQLLGQ